MTHCFKPHGSSLLSSWEQTQVWRTAALLQQGYGGGLAQQNRVKGTALLLQGQVGAKHHRPPVQISNPHWAAQGLQMMEQRLASVTKLQLKLLTRRQQLVPWVLAGAAALRRAEVGLCTAVALRCSGRSRKRSPGAAQ